MPEHIHLVVSEPERNTLADALKSLKQGVARRLIGDVEHFWQKRYYDFNIRNHDQFVEKLHYTHCNPVHAGLCERPEDWPWSSFLHHASGCEGRIEIESEWTARKRERAAGSLGPAVGAAPLKPKPGLRRPPSNLRLVFVPGISVGEVVPLPRPRIQLVHGTVPQECAGNTLPARSEILCRPADEGLRCRPLPTSSTRAPEVTSN